MSTTLPATTAGDGAGHGAGRGAGAGPGRGAGRAAGPLRRLVVGHPVATTSALLVGLSWLAHAGAMAAGLPAEAGILASLIVFLAVPLAVCAVLGGRAEARRLLARVVRWRFGAGWWLVILLAFPVLTTAVALATGTYRAPADGWGAEVIGYLVMGLLVLGVTGNVPEELAWAGFVQSRLMERHGLVVAALLTAIPFALVHLPLHFYGQDPSDIAWAEVGSTYGITVAIAPFMRYVMGAGLLGTGGSVLAVGLLHASFNASGRLSVVDGWWQYAVALVVMTVLVAGYRYVTGRRSDRSDRTDRTDAVAAA